MRPWPLVLVLAACTAPAESTSSPAQAAAELCERARTAEHNTVQDVPRLDRPHAPASPLQAPALVIDAQGRWWLYDDERKALSGATQARSALKDVREAQRRHAEKWRAKDGVIVVALAPSVRASIADEVEAILRELDFVLAQILFEPTPRPSGYPHSADGRVAAMEDMKKASASCAELRELTAMLSVAPAEMRCALAVESMRESPDTCRAEKQRWLAAFAPVALPTRPLYRAGLPLGTTAVQTPADRPWGELSTQLIDAGVFGIDVR